MLRAAELLLTTSGSILQVAEQVGYLDSNNFSTAFKNTMDISPRQYRQKFSVTVHQAKMKVHHENVLVLEDS
jgi:AraC-like DNA-binding protein